MNILINTQPDFSFFETVISHGWRQLRPFSWDDESRTLSRIHRLESGQIVKLSLADSENGVNVSSDAELDPDEISTAVATMLQLDLDIAAFHSYCVGNPKLSHIPGKKQGRLLRSPTVFEDVLKVLTTTNTTWTQTRGMTGLIVENFGEPFADDPEQKAFPTPEQIASVPFDEFASKTKMGYRNASAHKIATDVAEGRLDLESFRDRSVPTADLYKTLLTLPGIGPYAASCLLIYLGRYDRVNVDSWARTMVKRELGRSVTDKEVHAFFDEFGEWKALAYHFYAWKDEPIAY